MFGSAGTVRPVTLVHRVLPPEPYASLDEYLARGGGVGLANARNVEPVAIIDEIEASGLRGRGGAGFPTGVKWRTVAAYASPAVRTTVVVNAAEGEPSTYKDRTIIQRNPYEVIEGALIAAIAIGATHIILATKEVFTAERARLAKAVEQFRAEGLVGDVQIEIVTGPDEYLFGEETALLEVIDGRPPFPRIAPPYRRGVDEVVEEDEDATSGSGLSAHVEMAAPGDEFVAPPALVDNVETMANIPRIIGRGAAWFRTEGTDASPGTIVCTVSGAVQRAGVAEVMLGTTVREAIEEVGGGLADGVEVKVVMTGVSTAALTPEQLDTPMTYEDMAAIGAGLGTGTLHVVGADTNATAIAAGVARFLAVESCGQCTPCKTDGLTIADVLEKMCAGDDATSSDFATLERALANVGDGARCNLARQQQAVIIPLVDRFRGELTSRLDRELEPIEPVLISEVRSFVDGTVEIDETRRTKQPDWTHDDEWGGATPADLFGDHRVQHHLD
jgi:NADH:ubiquinone oxidoreductase subunit F (NADH-binding)